MFERYTSQARSVFVYASEEAREFKHGYIGTEHLLIGVIRRGDSPASMVLGMLGVSLEDARRMLEDIIGRGTHRPTGRIPFTPRAKRVLELASEQALQTDYSFIRPEHILLGIALEGGGVGVQILESLGGGPSVVRSGILELMGQADPQASYDTAKLVSTKSRLVEMLKLERDNTKMTIKALQEKEVVLTEKIRQLALPEPGSSGG